MELVMQWHDGRKINQIEPIKGQLYVFFVLFCFFVFLFSMQRRPNCQQPAANMLAGSSLYSWCNLSGSNVGKYLAVFSVHACVVYIRKSWLLSLESQLLSESPYFSVRRAGRKQTHIDVSNMPGGLNMALLRKQCLSLNSHADTKYCRTDSMPVAMPSTGNVHLPKEMIPLIGLQGIHLYPLL